MDACASYVSMLQARRAEEEASRASRAQRRANVVAANNEMYKRRANAIRRRSMEEKLNMTSFKEKEIFDELSALSKWRHVMYENIAYRENQHADAERLQTDLLSDHLANVRRHEDARFRETVRDDKERFDAVRRATVEAKQRRVLETCRGVVDDVVRAAEEHIEFTCRHGLEGKGAVPLLLSRSMTRRAAFPTNGEQVAAALVARHVDLSVYQTDASTPRPEETHSKLFVSLVHKILHLHYPKPPPFKPKHPSAIPIVAIVGPKYSGKSTVATAVASSLGMITTSDVQLVQMAISEFSRDMTEQDWNSETNAELLDLGRECQETLLAGNPISVDLLARLILYQLRHVSDDCQGILLDGAPSSVEGFERLEAALSGYDKTRITTIPDELLAPMLEDVNIDDAIFNMEKVDTGPQVDAALLGAKKDAKAAKPKGKKGEEEDPLPPVELPFVEPIPPLSEEEEEALAAVERDADVSSLHSLIHLDCPAEEIFRRFGGLRLDTETGRIYHLVNDPPPQDRLPFLVARDRSEASTAKIHKMVEQHLEEWAECTAWFSRYDGVIHEVDSAKPQSEVITAITDLVNLAADQAGAYYQRYALAEEVRQRQAEMNQVYLEAVANRETVRKQLAAIYMDRGVELPAELQEPVKAVETQLLSVPTDFTPLFLDQLHAFTKYYSSSVNLCHTELDQLARQLYEYGNTCESFVSIYWQQPDAKQSILDAFIAEFNQMQPALRRDVQGKEELHLRAEQLTEQLFSVVERRKEECTQLIEALHHRSTMTDSWSDAVRATAVALLQCEVERLFTVRNLSLLYFSALKNDPCSIEEELLELIPTLRMVAQDVTVDPKTVKDKKAPPPKKSGKGAEETTDRVAEDIFTPAVERALQIMKSTVDRLTSTGAASPGKGKEKGKQSTELVEPQGPHALVAPIVAEEYEAAKIRVQSIVAFVKDLLQVGQKRVESVRSKLLGNLRKKQITQSSAVNSATFEVRCAIEEERPVLYYLHLGTESFNIDTSRVLATMADEVVCLSGVPFAGLAAPPVQETLVLTRLTKSRVLELIAEFRILAPAYDIHKQDFVLIVRPTDYQDAAPREEPRPVSEIFDRFDISGCGAIDWRDFLMHLLFWCEPIATDVDPLETAGKLSYTIEGPSLTQLFEMRADVGTELLSREEFLDTPLFFDADMAEDRLMAYLDLLWEIFHVDDTISPDVLMTFFCPDPQPLRGIQKAFVVASTPGDETCAARVEALDVVFHMNATCPRRMLMYDPHAPETLASLCVEGADTLVFGDACKSHVGRVLFNSTKTFLRKSFV